MRPDLDTGFGGHLTHHESINGAALAFHESQLQLKAFNVMVNLRAPEGREVLHSLDIVCVGLGYHSTYNEGICKIIYIYLYIYHALYLRASTVQ